MQDTTKKVVSWTDPETWSSIESSNENTVLRNEPSGDRAVKATRLVLVLLLLVSAGALGWATYYITNSSTAANFNQNWGFLAGDFLAGSTERGNRIFNSTATIAALYPTFADQTGVSLPFLTLRDFERYGMAARGENGVDSVVFSPILWNDSSREVWDQYSEENQGWVRESFSFHPNLTYTSQSIRDYIWDWQGAVPANSEPYLPSWQMSPPPVDANATVNFNYASVPGYSPMMQHVVNSQSAILSEPADLGAVWGTGVSEMAVPTSLLLQPVFSTFNASASASVIGLVSSVVPWVSFFADVLQTGQDGVVVVAESCGQNHSYLLNGPVASYLGSGDRHDPKYSLYVYQDVFANFGGAYTSSSSDYHCLHKLYVFPTDATKTALTKTDESFSSNKDTVILTSVVVAAFVLAALVFLFYDWLLRRRIAAYSDGGTKSDCYYSSLMPAVVRSSGVASEHTSLVSSKEEGKWSAKGGHAEVMGTKEELMQYINRSVKPDFGSKPIAELYPEATVLFADIAGFTAWSSIREPSQVFTLLESIFGVFDSVANACGVFKVETVGDCYVAVCGLPEPNHDHAIVMARFARECMEKGNEAVRELELTLGPDTADLAFRIGVHSGPITAGVLRGERARFQLFGDTVNTAARMESTGKRNRIHLSEQTASLILATGRKNWVIEREDPVEAKGKGVMRTYWLLTVAADMEGSPYDNSTARMRTTEDYIPKSSFMERIEAIKEYRASKERRMQRLVQWNSEMLIQMLKQVVAHREKRQRPTSSPVSLANLARNVGNECIVVEEVTEIIMLPEFQAHACSTSAKGVELPKRVVDQVQRYVSVIASMYRDNPFHNFEHASHVTMSVSKLLSRIAAPQIDTSQIANDETRLQATLHDHTFGITSDPLTQFAVVLAALIHDVDHRGVPNFILNNEEKTLAAAYKGKSVAEQNSVDLAWRALMCDGFEELRACIFDDAAELKRFRQLLVNAVIATDIFDKELGAARKARWDKAFDDAFVEDRRMRVNRKATIVIEHLMQASDVAHTMQHWHVYTKWNEKLFQEMYEAYRTGRSDTDPSTGWYQGEIGFFDNYIIPLAKKLKDCGVFGVASDEYLNYARENRREWAARGQDLVANFIEKHARKEPVPLYT